MAKKLFGLTYKRHLHDTQSTQVFVGSRVTMKRFFKRVLTVSAVSALAIIPTLLPVGKASAQTFTTNGTDANYLGGGISVGVTDGDSPLYDDDSKVGGNIQGRFAIPNAPISARGAVLFGGDSTAIMPLVTYDVPVAPNTNLYLGGGYSFNTEEGNSSPLGNKDAVVLTAGAESEVGSNIVLYGDAKWGIDAYEDSNSDAVSIQAGAAYRFN